MPIHYGDGAPAALRLVVYNIRYATGTGPAFHLPLPGAGYLRSNKRVLRQLTEFLRAQDADLIGLIEIDTGSIRSGMVNQAESIATALGHYSIYECKYGTGSINQFLPILRKQSNAFLAAPRVQGERFHYFDSGIKRLIIELELDDVCVFLVHLSLKYRHRQYQLRYLHDLIDQVKKPVIVAGDFNTFWGTHERSWTSCWSARRSRSRASRFPTSGCRTTVRWSAISRSGPDASSPHPVPEV